MAAHPVQITDTNFIVTNQPHQRLQKKHWSLLVSQAAKTRRKRYEPIPLRPAGRFQWTQSTDDRNLIIENAGQQGEQEQSAGLTLRLSSPTNDNHFGALRKDPFNSFPVQDKSIPQALDNHVHVYCPMIYPLQAALHLPDPYVRIILPYAMQHPELFASCLMNQHMFWAQMTAPPGTRPDLRQTFNYRGLAIQELRKKLLRATNNPGGAADDAAILTTMFLLGTDNLSGATGVYEIHREALGKMITARGGLDKLGLEGVLKNQLLRFNAFFQHEHGQPSFLPANSVVRPKNLLYPSPPHPPNVISLLNNLPPALLELALHSHLSIEVLTTVSQLHEWIASLNRMTRKRATEQDIHLLSNHDTNSGSQMLMYLAIIDAQQPTGAAATPAEETPSTNNAGGASEPHLRPLPLSLPQTLRTPNPPPPPAATHQPFNAERLLCAAAGVFLLTLHTGPRMRTLKMFTHPFASLEQVFADLASAPPRTRANRTRAERELILWSAFVLGTNAAALPRRRSGEVQSVLREYCFGEGAEGPRSEAWGDVRVVLERIFWIEMKEREWRGWWEGGGA